MKKKLTTENTDEHGVKISENFRGFRAIRGKNGFGSMLIMVNTII
jgi:hypothetical protein